MMLKGRGKKGRTIGWGDLKQCFGNLWCQSLSHSNSLRPHGLQCVRLPHPSLPPGGWSNSCNLLLPELKMTVYQKREAEGNSTTMYELTLEGTQQLPPHLLEVSFKANPYRAEDKHHKKQEELSKNQQMCLKTKIK